MLSNEEILKNKESFISILSALKNDENDINGLINYLDKNGFFEAPASTKYHCSYKGGLCEHSLNVYNAFMSLVGTFKGSIPPHYNSQGIDDTQSYLLEVAIKVALLHDLAKVNYYETYSRNVKNDSTGQWEKVKEIRVKDGKSRSTFGTYAFNTYMLLSRFITLDDNEIATLINFNCGMDDNYTNKDLGVILSKYPLAILLHSADLISTYMVEKDNEQID